MTRSIVDVENKGNEPKVTEEEHVEDWHEHMCQHGTLKILSAACKENGISNRYEAKIEKLARIVM